MTRQVDKSEQVFAGMSMCVVITSKNKWDQIALSRITRQFTRYNLRERRRRRRLNHEESISS
jgi:hypothetical protein